MSEKAALSKDQTIEVVKVNNDKEIARRLSRFYGDLFACEICGVDITEVGMLQLINYCSVC